MHRYQPVPLTPGQLAELKRHRPPEPLPGDSGISINSYNEWNDLRYRSGNPVTAQEAAALRASHRALIHLDGLEGLRGSTTIHTPCPPYIYVYIYVPPPTMPSRLTKESLGLAVHGNSLALVRPHGSY